MVDTRFVMDGQTAGQTDEGCDFKLPPEVPSELKNTFVLTLTSEIAPSEIPESYPSIWT